MLIDLLSDYWTQKSIFGTIFLNFRHFLSIFILSYHNTFIDDMTYRLVWCGKYVKVKAFKYCRKFMLQFSPKFRKLNHTMQN